MPAYSLPLRSGVIALRSSVLDLGAEVMYATIEASIVTAITFGLLPASDDVTYYVNIAGIDPEPLVAWYFNDDCQTFSATPPVIPAGEISPPYTPGGTPPVLGDPGYPPTELDPADDPEPLASTAPFWISFHADGVASVAVAGGADYAEVSALMRTIVRIQDICAARLQAHVDTEDTGLTLYLCASLDDGVTWLPISAGGTGPKVTLAAAGTLAGRFLNVDPALVGDILVNVCTKGSGAAVVGNVLACFYVKTTEGVCIEIGEGTGCGLRGSYERGTDFTYADYAAWYAERATDNLFTTFGAPTTEDPDYAELLADDFGPYVALHHGFGGTDRGVGWSATGFAALEPFSGAMLTTSLDINLAGNSPGDGLVLFRWVSVGGAIMDIQLYSGRIWASVSGASPVDMGDAADICTGAPITLVSEAFMFSDAGYYSFGIVLYVDTPCQNELTYYGGSDTGLVLGSAIITFDHLDIATWDGPERLGDQNVYLYAIGAGRYSFND